MDNIGVFTAIPPEWDAGCLFIAPILNLGGERHGNRPGSIRTASHPESAHYRTYS